MKIWYQSFTDQALAPVYLEHLASFMNEHASEGTEIHFKTITPPDDYAHALSEWRCGREAIANAIHATDEGYDGYLMGHFQDSGLYEARAAAGIPVISLGEASMLYACQMGFRIGLITINPRFIPIHEHQIRKYGLQDRVTLVHAMTFDPGELVSAFGDDSKVEAVREKFEEQALPLVKAGVDVLVPAGGIPMLLLSRIKAHEIAGAPVLNGLPVTLRMCELAIEMKQKFGTDTSRSSDFVRPPREVLDTFLNYPGKG